MSRPSRLPLYAGEAEDPDAVVRRAIALLLCVCSARRLHYTTRYAALAFLADRALPTLLAAAEAPPGAASSPGLFPLALACVLVASKLLEREGELISELLAAAARVAPTMAAAGRCCGDDVRAAELWLVTCASISLYRPLVDDVAALFLRLLEVAPALNSSLTVDGCCALVDLLYERPCWRGLLSAGGAPLAASIIFAAAALAVPPEARRSTAPVLAWLAWTAGSSVEEAQAGAARMVQDLLHAPSHALG